MGVHECALCGRLRLFDLSRLFNASEKWTMSLMVVKTVAFSIHECPLFGKLRLFNLSRLFNASEKWTLSLMVVKIVAFFSTLMVVQLVARCSALSICRSFSLEFRQLEQCASENKTRANTST